MKTVAVVPMKLNNQRLPQKNTRAFVNGKPLCEYIFSTLLTVDGLDEIYVYCSNPNIKTYMPNGIKFLQRSENLDTNTTSISDVLYCFAEDVKADIYLMSHATSPFVKKNSIEYGLNAVKSGKYDSAFAAVKVQDFLWADSKPMNYDLDNIPRTQDLKLLYKETSGFYIYEKEVITSLHRRIGYNPLIVEVSEIEAVDIDEMEDFMIAEAIFNHILLSEEQIRS
ncbi:MAG: acylneuraminate cytidylyltransferase family protein [Butyrivibrio sp.]|nr:acylneuraminate cytidylyltransferase family protein [Butyrivibrio sp.]